MREREQQRAEAARQRQARQLERDHVRAQRSLQRAMAEAQKTHRDRRIQNGIRFATASTADIAARVDSLESVLTDGLSRRNGFSIEQLRQVFHRQHFEPPFALRQVGAPQWGEFAPDEPRLGERIFKSGYERKEADARARFEQALDEHAAREQQRLEDLAKAQAQHDAVQAAREEEVVTHNAQVDRLTSQLDAGVAAAVEEYFELLLERVPLPAELPVDVEVAYQPDSRKLLVIRELPTPEIIPEEREYVYVRSRDEVTAKKRAPKEIQRLYSSLVAQIVLLTMRDAFETRPAHHVDEVAVNGMVSTTNKATGREERPCLVSVSATREQFDNLVLNQLDPVECLRHLNALISRHPWDLEAVRPIFDPDLSKYRLIDAHGVAAGLDARPVLLELPPLEFEHLVRELFEAMGMESWITQASRDDGVDAVAVNRDPIMGGLCIVQAKRYSGVVEADAVRALAGVMDDKRASRGVLVTTSWLGKASHDFAARHGRIQLIEGPELKHMLAQYLSLDVLIGALKRRNKK